MPSNVVQIVFRGINQVSGQVQAINSSINRLQTSLRSIGFAIGTAFSVREIGRAADTYLTIENRLRLVTKSSEELAAVQERLFALSQETRSGFKGTVDLYSRVARSSKELGLSQQELIDFTRTVNQAIQVSGSTSIEAAAGVIQFSQALASSRLSGDELRSVLEQMPRLARAIAEGLGVTIGQLREMGQQGKLTAKTVIDAITSQAAAINSEFGNIQVTISSAFTVLNNSLVNLIGTFFQSTGAGRAFIDFLLEGAEVLDDVAKKMKDSDTAIGQANAKLIEQGRIMNNLMEDIAIAKGEIMEGPPGLIDRMFGETQLDRAMNLNGMEEQLKDMQFVFDGLQAEYNKLKDAQVDLNKKTGTVVDTTNIYEGAVGRMLKKLEEQAALLGKTGIEAELMKFKLEGATDVVLEHARAALEVIDAYERMQERLSQESRSAISGDMVGPVEEVADGLDEMANYSAATWAAIRGSGEDAAKKVSTAWDQAIRNIQSSLADSIFNFFDEGLRGMLKSFIDTIRKMIAEALAARLVEKMFGKGGRGSEGDGQQQQSWLGRVLEILIGKGKATGGWTTPGVLHPVNEQEPEFLMTAGRDRVVPLSKASANGIQVGGGLVFAPVNNTTVQTSMNPFELEMMMQRRDDALMAKFMQMRADRVF